MSFPESAIGIESWPSKVSRKSSPSRSGGESYFASKMTRLVILFVPIVLAHVCRQIVRFNVVPLHCSSSSRSRRSRLMGGDDHAAPGAARGQPRLALTHYDSWAHGGQRAFAGFNLVRLALNKSVRVRFSGTGGKIRHFIVEQHAGAGYCDV